MGFSRPGWRRLLADVESGKVDTVLVRDLSRLGRDHIQTGYYLEMLFPRLGVRCIAVSEQYDSQRRDGSQRWIPFYFALNDLYAQDISQKVRESLRGKKLAGQFIGRSAPFGYRKDPAQAGHLLPDERTAPWLRRLWQCFLSCGSVSATARWLGEQGVPPPALWKSEQALPPVLPAWQNSILRRMLSNPTYQGDLTQNRSERLGPKLREKRDLRPEEWITVRDTHTALISRADFAAAQRLLQQRRYQPGQREGHPLSGLARCAQCGAPMTYTKSAQGESLMLCSAYRRKGRASGCSSHRVRERAVLEALAEGLQELLHLPAEQALAKLAPAGCADGDAAAGKDADEEMLENLYRDRMEGRLSEACFLRLLAHHRQRERLPKQDAVTPEETLHGRALRLLSAVPPQAGVLRALLARVEVEESGDLVVVLAGEMESCSQGRSCVTMVGQRQADREEGGDAQ